MLYIPKYGILSYITNMSQLQQKPTAYLHLQFIT